MQAEFEAEKDTIESIAKKALEKQKEKSRLEMEKLAKQHENQLGEVQKNLGKGRILIDGVVNYDSLLMTH